MIGRLESGQCVEYLGAKQSCSVDGEAVENVFLIDYTKQVTRNMSTLVDGAFICSVEAHGKGLGVCDGSGKLIHAFVQKKAIELFIGISCAKLKFNIFSNELFFRKSTTA